MCIRDSLTFSPIDWPHWGSFWMSFGYKISTGSENTSCQSSTFPFLLHKTDVFLHFQLWQVVKSVPVKIFEPKLFEKLFPSMQEVIDEKMRKLSCYTPTKKYPGSCDFLRQILTVFGNFLKKYLRYREVIYLIGKPSFSAFWRSKDIGRGLTYLSATPF